MVKNKINKVKIKYGWKICQVYSQKLLVKKTDKKMRWKMKRKIGKIRKYENKIK